jgi:hypothetical protein
MEVLTDGPVRVGTRFRETRIVFKREATEEMEVTALEPPERFAFGCESHGCRYHTQMTFEPASGGTDVELRFEAVPLTRSMKVLAFLMAPMTRWIAKTCAKDLEDLKAAAERSPLGSLREGDCVGEAGA